MMFSRLCSFSVLLCLTLSCVGCNSGSLPEEERLDETFDFDVVNFLTYGEGSSGDLPYTGTITFSPETVVIEVTDGSVHTRDDLRVRWVGYQDVDSSTLEYRTSAGNMLVEMGNTTIKEVCLFSPKEMTCFKDSD
jgi:hypothetical protein